ncbi:MAG: hypothetical protein IK103_03515 [Bacteroidales bacterium]|nr:hypothetical protein [Bacteroidales bacterium]
MDEDFHKGKKIDKEIAPQKAKCATGVSEIDKDMCHFFEQKEWDKEITPYPTLLIFSTVEFFARLRNA